MYRILLICIISVVFIQDVIGACTRIPQGASGERSAVDDNFKILIDGNPTTYIPDHQYNISLSCPLNLKFISFTLVVESEDQSGAFNPQDMTGHFELFSSAETRFTTGCENMVENTNTNAKTRIDVSWIAPKLPESGCVLIKAGVVQHRDVWFIDDGFLTKRICPEEIDELNSQTPTLTNCCACDEAKYEIVLERKWARNTHAKHFPAEAWRTRIGEIIGSSHSYSYRYWAYGGRASQGMRELAEHGATRTLEQEIRDNTQNGEVRTIIKAPGIAYRKNVFGTTLANARVDPQHHQISLVAKIDPSPDWIVGVAGLELCLSNCTWLERKVLNLYPWDIGTDSGPSYMSADQPQVPPDVIRRISSTYPSDYRSPFFDDTGSPMKPLATLYLTRKKLYIRECEEVPQEGPLECATHPWNDWSNCSTRCGSGYSQRFRSYKNPTLAASYNCDRRLEEMSQCQGTQCGLEEELSNGDASQSSFDNPYQPNTSNSIAECELTMWSNWSPCSKTCGRGFSTRTRSFRNERAKARCQTVVRLPMEESRTCSGSDCGGTIPDNGELDGIPDPELFGETNEGSYDRPAWGSNKYSTKKESGYTDRDRNNQGWNSNSYNNVDSKRRQPVEVYRPISNSYHKEQLVGNRVNSYKDYKQDNRANDNMLDNRGNNYLDYKQDNRANSYNDNRQDNKASNYNDYKQDNKATSYNDYKQDNKATNYNDYKQDNKATNYNDYKQDNKATNYHDYEQGSNNNEYTTPYFSPFLSTRAPYGRNIDRQQDVGNKYNVVQSYCYEKPFASTEPCLANPVVVRNFWFYDHDDHECKIFTTDNCDLNDNRFRTLMACEGTCLLPQINLARTEDNDENGYEGGSIQGKGGFDDGFNEPMSQTGNKYNNVRRGRNGN